MSRWRICSLLIAPPSPLCPPQCLSPSPASLFLQRLRLYIFLLHPTSLRPPVTSLLSFSGSCPEGTRDNSSHSLSCDWSTHVAAIIATGIVVSSHKQLQESPALAGLGQILLPDLTVPLLNGGKNKICYGGLQPNETWAACDTTFKHLRVYLVCTWTIFPHFFLQKSSLRQRPILEMFSPER